MQKPSLAQNRWKAVMEKHPPIGIRASQVLNNTQFKVMERALHRHGAIIGHYLVSTSGMRGGLKWYRKSCIQAFTKSTALLMQGMVNIVMTDDLISHSTSKGDFLRMSGSGTQTFMAFTWPMQEVRNILINRQLLISQCMVQVSTWQILAEQE
ncbi:Hypp5352 [Branchiostoma lanceolatum]|uniref:Hypp5352 protein n=1 Tax=Branchiostoma lanceolatum TaxID=7740 RepID=A0A8K0AIG0_BRALA|nr:Hypp5352 [Branchiostoma lanceolatum]